MRHSPKFIAGILALSCITGRLSPQVQASSTTAEGQVILSKLAEPNYPPLARQARITGDVELTLRIRQDGSVDSVQAASGHPLLRDAAIDSAKKSAFQCRNCLESPASYSLLYTFKLESGCCCAVMEDAATYEPRHPIGVYASGNHITVIAEPTCICDPPTSIRRARSLKCLYLWRCASQ